MQIGQVAQLGWDAAGELVGAEVKTLQIGQVAQLGWDAAGELVLAEVKDLQIGQVAQLGWDAAGELVGDEGKFGDTISRAGHPIPTAFCPKCTIPTAIIDPVVTIGAIVKSN